MSDPQQGADGGAGRVPTLEDMRTLYAKAYREAPTLRRERDAAIARFEATERVVEAAREAITHGDVYRRALASELRRLAPDVPLNIHPDLSLKAGATMGRFRAAYDAITTHPPTDGSGAVPGSGDEEAS